MPILDTFELFTYRELCNRCGRGMYIFIVNLAPWGSIYSVTSTMMEMNPHRLMDLDSFECPSGGHNFVPSNSIHDFSWPWTFKNSTFSSLKDAKAEILSRIKELT